MYSLKNINKLNMQVPTTSLKKRNITSFSEQSESYFPLSLVTVLNFVLIIPCFSLLFYHLCVYPNFSFIFAFWTFCKWNHTVMCCSFTCFCRVIFFLDLSLMHRGVSAVYYLNILQFVYLLFCRLYYWLMISNFSY